MELMDKKTIQPVEGCLVRDAEGRQLATPTEVAWTPYWIRCHRRGEIEFVEKTKRKVKDDQL